MTSALAKGFATSRTGVHVDPLDVALQHLSDPQATLAEGGTENLEIGVTRV
jgi:hypothetical protein